MQHRGFTMVELLVSMTVATLLIATAVPGMLGAMRTYQGVKAREDLIQCLRMARQAAITRHCPVIVRFGDGTSTSGITSYLMHVDTNGDRIIESNERQMLFTLPPGVTLSSVQLAPTDSLIFDISGALWPGTSGGRLVFSNRGGPDTLNVSAVGMVYQP